MQDGKVDPPAPEDWTDIDIANRAKVAQNVVVVCPLRNVLVSVELEVHAQKSSIQLSRWDHVVLCDLSLPSGRLQVHECTGGELLNWAITPGHYQVALLYSGLGTLSQDGLQGEDTYHVLLWPGSAQPLQVLRSWQVEA